MTIHITVTEILTVLVALMAFAALAIIAVRRKLKAYTIRITDDYSNNNAGYRAYYAMYDKTLDAFVLMKTLLSIWPYKTIRFINFSAYEYGRKTVDAIESYTGTPGDTDVIPVHHTTPSRLGIENWLVTLRGSLVKLLQDGGECNVLDANGKVIMTPKLDKDGKEVIDPKTKAPVMVPKTEHLELKLTDEQKKILPRLVSVSWFGTANGYLPVENIGVLREDIRQAAKRFYAKSYDKERAGEGFLVKYGAVIAFGIMLLMVGLGMGLYWQFFFGHLTTFCQAGYCPNYAIAANAGGTAGQILPNPTTAVANALLTNKG